MDMNINNIKNISDSYFKHQYSSIDDHIFLKGKLPIMISAPHAVTQFRHGKPKKSESYTAAMAELLHKHGGLHAIIKTKNQQDDANYDVNSYYRDELILYIKKEGIKLLLDIHIMKPSNKNTIEMATGNGENILQKDWIIEDIIKVAHIHDIKDVVSDSKFFALNPNCIAATVSREARIPAIQIELNWGELTVEDGQIDGFSRIFHTFKEIGNHFGVFHPEKL